MIKYFVKIIMIKYYNEKYISGNNIDDDENE